MSWYYRSEVKGIQSWILSTSRMRDLKGGSAVIEALPKHASDLLKELGITPLRELQRAAGALFLEFPSKEDRARFASEWPMRVHTAAPGLQVVQAWTDEVKDPRQALNQRLGAARNKPHVDLPEVGPWVARAGRSGLPAIAGEDVDGTNTDRIREVKERGKKAGSKWESIPVATDGVLGDRTIALEVDDKREGLIAVVHADGTGVGQRAMQASNVGGQFSAEAARKFSEALSGAAEDALRRALTEVINERRVTTQLEVQVIVLGGDDLTFVCAADLALDLTRKWLRYFEGLTAERLPKQPDTKVGFNGLRAGAGIAYTSPRFPFHMAYSLAEELCATAKVAAKRNSQTPVDSVLALRRVTNSVEDNRLAQGVWAVGENIMPGAANLPPISALLELSEAAKKLPRGGLRTWLTVAEDAFANEPHRGADAEGNKNSDALPISATAAKLWERLREVHEGPMKGLEEALKNCRASETTGTGPDLGTGKRRWTPIRDALVLTTVERRAKK